DVPLIEALRYVTQLSGLKFKVEPFAVAIVPLTESTDILITKTYRVPPNFISTAPAGGAAAAAPAGGAPGAEPSIVEKAGAKEFLEQSGVQFPPGASAYY